MLEKLEFAALKKEKRNKGGKKILEFAKLSNFMSLVNVCHTYINNQFLKKFYEKYEKL